MSSWTKSLFVLLVIIILIHDSESRWGKFRRNRRNRRYHRPPPCKPCNCKVGPWSQWNSCSVTCGNGVKGRYRHVVQPAKCGGTCFYTFSEARPCHMNHCPVNGGWCSWSSWTSCNKPCGGGTRSRSRSCTKPPPAYGGAQCYGSSHGTTPCNTHKCPVNGGWCSWSSWTSCNKPCGGGTRSRSRSCTKPPPAYGGAQCYGSSHGTTSCNTHKCPVNGGWSLWSSWTSCDKQCGGGSKSRSRSCTNPPPAHGGAGCYGSSEETRSCNTQKCPVNGGWSSWSSWTTCSKSCGGGRKSRSRSCTSPSPAHGGANCYGSSEEKRSCNTQTCGIDGGWCSWSSWTECTKSCGGGQRSRKRTCTKPPPSGGGAPCKGPSKETDPCNIQSCDDGSYKDYTQVGCYKDNKSSRTLPVLLGNFRKGIDWSNIEKTVEKCADAARSHGYEYFALQFYGECYSGYGSENNYDKYGSSKNCWKGVGKEGTNFVYKFTYIGT